jgi:uncharacterized membrane protein YqjE
MADPGAGPPAVPNQPSLGELVSVAVADTSKLIRCELDLAKMELKADAQRLGVGAVLIGIAAFFGCLVLVMLSFTYAYGLIAADVWPWAAFALVALTWALLGGAAVAIAYSRMRGLTGLRKTRKTVADDLALIRRDGDQPARAVPAGRS